MMGRCKFVFLLIGLRESGVVFRQIASITGIAFHIAAKEIPLAKLQFLVLARQTLEFARICGAALFDEGQAIVALVTWPGLL